MRSKDPSTLRIIDLWTFKSTKSHKRYIVQVEHFPSNFYGVKFYWKAMTNSEKRYSLMTNDYEPRTIVLSCIEIMRLYLEKAPLTSFAFVAAEDLNVNKNLDVSKRFRFYRRMMLSIFVENTFIQANNTKTGVYMLLNRKSMERGDIDIYQIEQQATEMFYGDFSLNIEQPDN